MTSVRRRLMLNQGIPIVTRGQCGPNAFWTLDANGLLKITGSGEMTSGFYQSAYASAITSVYIEDGITTLANDAFRNLSNLTNVSFSDSVIIYNTYTFYNSTKLSNIEYRGTLESWINNTSLSNSWLMSYVKNIKIDGITYTDMAIPNGVTTVRNYCFQNYKTLASVTIPDSVTSIGNYAFADCSDLTSIQLGTNIQEIGSSVFPNCVLLTNVTIPNGVATINESTFYDCKNLHVNIPSSVNLIKSYAFYDVGKYNKYSVIDFSQATQIPTLEQYCFLYAYLTVIVPDALYDDWVALGKFSAYSCDYVKASEWEG